MNNERKLVEAVFLKLKHLKTELDPNPDLLFYNDKEVKEMLSEIPSLEDELQIIFISLDEKGRIHYFNDLKKKINEFLEPFKIRGYFYPFNENKRLNDDMLKEKFLEPILKQRNIQTLQWPDKFSLIIEYVDLVLNFLEKIEKYIHEVNYIKEAVSEDAPLLEHLSHILTLYYELGIINLLRERLKDAGVEDNKSLATLIGSLSLNNKKKDIEAMRRALSYLDTNHKNDPITINSVNSVKAILAKIGLETKNF